MPAAAKAECHGSPGSRPGDDGAPSRPNPASRWGRRFWACRGARRSAADRSCCQRSWRRRSEADPCRRLCRPSSSGRRLWSPQGGVRVGGGRRLLEVQHSVVVSSTNESPISFNTRLIFRSMSFALGPFKEAAIASRKRSIGVCWSMSSRPLADARLRRALCSSGAPVR